MTARNDAFVSALVEGLARSGVRHACISPGSRNTPLSLAFAAHPGIADWSHHDERSGSFFALGLSAATGEPVVVVTTSGTAAAEVHAAVLEAAASHTPLLIITADRPTELHDVGAPQTVDQRRLYGTAVRWHHDLDVPDPADVPGEVVAALAARMALEATTSPAAPVHLNVRFREPLIVEPRFDDNIVVPTIEQPVLHPSEPALGEIAALLGERSGIIVAGPSREPDLPLQATRFAAAVGWPILADPISGLRAGTHSIDHVVGSDLLAVAGALEALRPEAVIRIGAPPTSKRLRQWLASSSVPQVLIAPGGWPDPDSSARLVVRADTSVTLAALTGRVEAGSPEWMPRWAQAHRSAVGAADAAVRENGFPSEPAVVGALASSTPDGATIWTASSMPIRDVDSFFPVVNRPIAIHGNRGANGIDGLASTALGTAATGAPTIAHLGDLSMLHDIGALATAIRLDLPVTFLVVNNDGGGIFHFLPQAGQDHFERHFGTPHGLSFRAIAEGFGLDAVLVDNRDDLDIAIADTPSGPRLVEVSTDREANVQLHRDIATAVAGVIVGV